MKYPLPATADGYALHQPRAETSSAISDVMRWTGRHWGLLAAIIVTLIIHIPTLGYFFNGDDFVVLGDIERRGASQYLWDTVRMQDIVPNWRPLTAAVYTLEWRLFGLDATGWRSVNLSVHLVSVVLLYMLVLRATRRPTVGAVAAMIFGISGSHFDTVTYVTALPHVLATSLTLASLLAIVTYAQGRERRPELYWASFLAFTLAFLANEGAFVYAPVIVATYALFAERWRRAPLRLVLHTLPFAALATGWLVFYESCDCEQLKFDGYTWGPHVFRNYAVYLSWIAYPVRHVPLTPDAWRWAIASVVLAFAAIMALRGPHLARVSALGMVLALLPFVPVEIWTASRYTYAAVAFFAPMAAIAGYAVFDRARQMHRYARVPVHILGLAFLATLTLLYAWQTSAQDERNGGYTERWRLLATELRTQYPDVPDGTTIYIIGGPWTNPMEQYTWVPSVARALYGNAAAFNFTAEDFAVQDEPPPNSLFLRWNGERLEQVTPEQVAGP